MEIAIGSFSGTPNSLRRARICSMRFMTRFIPPITTPIYWEVGGLWVAGEGDGFGGRKAGVEGVPDFFGEEGHEGREQAQRRLEDVDEGGEGSGGCGLVCGFVEVEAELDDFEVPVAELAPEELVDRAGGFVEAIVGECAVNLGGDGVEARENPAGFERNRYRWRARP